MGRFPTYDTPQVAARPLPVPQLTGASPAGFGGALGRGLADLGGQLANIGLAEKAKADSLAVDIAIGKLNNARSELLFGAEGAYRREGKDALHVVDQYGTQFRAAGEQLLAEMANDEQRASFRGFFEHQIGQVSNELSRYQLGRMEEYDDRETNATLQSSIDKAARYFNDPARIAEAIGEVRAVLGGRADRKGWSDTQLLAAITTEVSRLHGNVLQQFISQGLGQQAQAYLDKYRNNQELDPELVANATKLIQPIAVDQHAEQLAMELVAGATDKHGNIDQAALRKTLDEHPTLRNNIQLKDETTRRVEHRVATSRAGRESEILDHYQNAAAAYLQTGSLLAVPPAEKAWLLAQAPEHWRQLTLWAQSDHDHEERRARDGGRLTNEDFDEFLTYATVGETISADPAAFARTPRAELIRRYGHLLNRQHLEETLDLHQRMGAELAKPVPDWKTVTGAKEAVLEAGAMAGLWSKEKGQIWTWGKDKIELWYAVDSAIQDFSHQYKATHGRAPGYEDLLAKAKDLLAPGRVPGLIWDSKRTRIQAEMAEEKFVPTIPPLDKAKITKNLQDKGLPLTEHNYQLEFEAHRSGPQEAINRLGRHDVNRTDGTIGSAQPAGSDRIASPQAPPLVQRFSVERWLEERRGKLAAQIDFPAGNRWWTTVRDLIPAELRGELTAEDLEQVSAAVDKAWPDKNLWPGQPDPKDLPWEITTETIETPTKRRDREGNEWFTVSVETVPRARLRHRGAKQ